MELGFLLRSHIADLLGVDDKTVSDYVAYSQPGGKMIGGVWRENPYVEDPVPSPAGYLDSKAPNGWVPPEERRPGLRPFWWPNARQDWLAWRERHPARDRKAS